MFARSMLYNQIQDKSITINSAKHVLFPRYAGYETDRPLIEI